MPLDQSSREMSFMEHLDELRVRLFRCALVFFLGFMAFYGIAEELMLFLKQPLFQILPEEQQKLYFTSLFENFLTHLKIAGYASLFFLSPYYFYQLWAFIAPGLYPKERKPIVPFALAAGFFFIGGAAFAYYVLFPVAFKFFVTFGGPTDFPILTIESYYSTVLKLLFLFGIAFELPVIIVVLGYFGVLDGKALRAHRSKAIIGITIACALFAPPDVVSMLILMAPLIILYEASIWVVDLIRKN